MRIKSICFLFLFLTACASWTGVNRPDYRPVGVTDEEAIEVLKTDGILPPACKSYLYENQNIVVCVGNMSILKSSITDRMSGDYNVFGLKMGLVIQNSTSADINLMVYSIRLIDDKGNLWSLKQREYISKTGTSDSYNSTIYPNSTGSWALYFGSAYLSKEDRPYKFTFYLEAYVGYQKLTYEVEFKQIDWSVRN